MARFQYILAMLLSVALGLSGFASGEPLRMAPRQTTATTSAPNAEPTACGDIIDSANEGENHLIQLVHSLPNADADPICGTAGYFYFYASDAFACLSTVPFVADVALRFIEYYNTTMQFQSTLAYLRDPPADYQQPPVDFSAALEGIKANVTAGNYVNQYAFESELLHLVYSMHDSHVNLYAGILSTFTFGNNYPLVSASLDGKQAPKVYLQGKYLLSPS